MEYENINQIIEVLNAYKESWIQFNKALKDWCDAFNKATMITHKQIHDMLYGNSFKANNWNKFHGYPMRRKNRG